MCPVMSTYSMRGKALMNPVMVRYLDERRVNPAGVREGPQDRPGSRPLEVSGILRPFGPGGASSGLIRPCWIHRLWSRDCECVSLGC